MNYKTLIFIGIFSTSAAAQKPLQSRVYIVSDAGKVERYEANLKLDSDMTELYLASVDINTCTKVNDPTSKLNSSVLVQAEVAAFDNTLKNVDCKLKNNLSHDISDDIPTGFGDLSFGSFNGGTQVEATLLRYNLHYSSSGAIPFYILATTAAGGNIDPENVKTNLVGTDGGLLNFKFADDVVTFNGKRKNGFCNFTSNDLLSGGCYLNYQLGAKMVEYTNEDGTTDSLFAGYTSIQLAFDFPITQDGSRAGRLVGAAGLSAYYANTEKVQFLFPEFSDSATGNVADLDKYYASFDVGLKFTISNVVDINVKSSIPLSNRDVFSNQTSISVSWRPK
jgi:hypothetical protein